MPSQPFARCPPGDGVVWERGEKVKRGQRELNGGQGAEEAAFLWEEQKMRRASSEAVQPDERPWKQALLRQITKVCSKEGERSMKVPRPRGPWTPNLMLTRAVHFLSGTL